MTRGKYYTDKTFALREIFRNIVSMAVGEVVDWACVCIMIAFYPVDRLTGKGKIWRIRHFTRFKIWLHKNMGGTMRWLGYDSYLKKLDKKFG